MINVTIDDRAIREALRNLQQHTGNLQPVMLKIGEKLAESTKHRFVTTTGPEGQRWPANTQVTIERYLDRKTGVFDDDGKRTGTKKGYFLKSGQAGVKAARLVAGKQPLTDGGILGDTINYQLLGNDGVSIGSPMEYAAMQQFGGTKAEFPQLWGDIPARPFLGISDADENAVLAILREYIESAI